MIHGSPAFEVAIRGSYTATARCEAWLAGRRVASDLPLREDSNISVDSSRFVRRQGKFSFVEDMSSSREALRSTLTRPGCELRVWRGVDLGGYVEDLPVHQGLADVVDGTWPENTIAVESPDLAQRVSYDGFPAPRQSAASLTVSQQIQVLIYESLASASILRQRFVDTTGDATVVRTVVWDQGLSTRNAAVDTLATSIGAEIFASPDGRWVLRPVQTLLGIPVLTVREGVALVSAATKVDWSRVQNDVIVTCERADGTKLRGRSTDNDPSSPTGVGSALGRRTGFYTTSLPTTSPQCVTIADARRARMQGARVNVDFETFVHPGMEAGDRHDVICRGTTYRLVVDSFELPLFGARMRVQARSQIDPADLT